MPWPTATGDHRSRTRASIRRQALGVAATPSRGDRRGLRGIFDNVADQVPDGRADRAGHLVPPRTYTIDVGVEEKLRRDRKTAGDYDMVEVARMLNRAGHRRGDRALEGEGRRPAHDGVLLDRRACRERGRGVQRGRRRGGGRARRDLDTEHAADLIARLDRGDVRVIVNVTVLTEGWDSPPTACVVMLRPMRTNAP